MENKKSAPTAATVRSANVTSQNQFIANQKKKQSPGGFDTESEVRSLLREAYIDGRSGVCSGFYSVNKSDFLDQIEKDNSLSLTDAERSFIIMLRESTKEMYEAGQCSAGIMFRSTGMSRKILKPSTRNMSDRLMSPAADRI